MSRKSPEERRLDRFTTDSKYGPKLSQLPKREQRRLTDLVTSNRGREARKALLAADTQRRETRNQRDRDRRRATAEGNALTNMTRRLPEARKGTLDRNLKNMTHRDLRFASEATRSELRLRASTGKRTLVDGHEVNLFWYN